MQMISIAEVLIVGLVALFLLGILAGLVLMIMHVFRLTKRVQQMEEQAKEIGEKE